MKDLIATVLSKIGLYFRDLFHLFRERCMYNKFFSTLANNLITTLILVNFFCSILAINPSYNVYLEQPLLKYELLLDVIFIAEIVIRILKRGETFFFGKKEYIFWNYFDLTITIVCTLSLISNYFEINPFEIFASQVMLCAMPANLRMIRIFRIFRLLRLVSVFGGVKKVMEALIKGIPQVFSIFILLLIIYSLFSIIGCRLYGEDFANLFGTFGTSMYTLFQVMTLDSWSAMVVQPIMEQYPYAWIYFITFICVTAYILLNAVTSIFVEIMQNSSDNNHSKENLPQHLESDIRIMQKKIDEQGKKINELLEILSKPK